MLTGQLALIVAALFALRRSTSTLPNNPPACGWTTRPSSRSGSPPSAAHCALSRRIETSFQSM